MIASGGATKITDFGIAKITASDQFTMTGTIVGTPHYMSPEQVQGRAVDGRSDQFSLGVMAFEMLTGEKPYTGENLTTVAYKIVSEEPVPPHRLNPTLAGSIDAVLRRALSKKPDSRFRTCQEFSDALERACAATAGWRTMPRGGSLNEPTVNQPRVTPTLPPARRPVRRDGPATGEHTSRKSAMLTFILLILAAAGLLALVGTRALPWLNPKIEIPKSEPRVEAPPLVETPKPQVPPPAAPDPADEKPSPMPVHRKRKSRPPRRSRKPPLRPRASPSFRVPEEPLPLSMAATRALRPAPSMPRPAGTACLWSLPDIRWSAATSRWLPNGKSSCPSS
jgi:serine/threonine-protein kinase